MRYPGNVCGGPGRAKSASRAGDDCSTAGMQAGVYAREPKPGHPAEVAPVIKPTVQRLGNKPVPPRHFYGTQSSKGRLTQALPAAGFAGQGGGSSVTGAASGGPVLQAGRIEVSS